MYAYLVALPIQKEALSDSEISSVVSHAESIRASSKSGVKTFDSIVNSLKGVSAVTMQVGKWAIKGESFYFLPYKEKSTSSLENVHGRFLSKSFIHACINLLLLK